MTDNEIIRCLRHCRAGDCENCKALNVCGATFSFHKEALDLINRQKTEIEKLNIESETLATQLKGAYEQIHKLNMAKSEAIKELWNKLQDYIFRDDFSVDGRLILDADEVKEVIQKELDK